MLGVVLAVVLAAPPYVRVVAAPEPAAVQAAQALRDTLAASGRLLLDDVVLVAEDGATSLSNAVSLQEARSLVQEAHGLYTALSAPEALAKIGEARALLGLLLDHPDGAALLAEAMRIKGLVHLFMEKPRQASAAFFSAYLLDPEYIPDALQWPPEARLAYADAIAAARRDPGGILSFDVQPPAAVVWLNGKKAGIGPTTVSGVAPGEHFVLATCPGYNRVTAVVTVLGGGKLNQAALYLEELPEETARRAQVAAFAAAFDHEDEKAAAKLLAEQLEAEVLVWVTPRAGAQAAWVLAGSGERLRDAVVVVSGNDAAREVEVAILGEPAPALTQPVPEAVPPAPVWYERWEVWLVLGAAAAVIGATAVYIGASQGQNQSMTFYLGGD